jgi:hypothetical protein
LQELCGYGSSGEITLVGIDGHSGSGKTSLARGLASLDRDIATLHTDDLAWHHSFLRLGIVALAMRISSFDKQAIAETKHLANVSTLPSDTEIAPQWEAFLAALARPAAQQRVQTLIERGLQKPGDVETRLGFHVGQLGEAADDA